MLDACFGITLPVGEMFEVDLNARSWFAEQMKRREGKLEQLVELGRCTFLVLKRLRERLHTFAGKGLHWPPAETEISPLVTKVLWEKL